MNPVTENLLWSWCGPFNEPLTFKNLQAMTGMDSDAIADVILTRDVTALWDAKHGVVYRPSDSMIRSVAGQYLQPFTVAPEPIEDGVIVRLKQAIA